MFFRVTINAETATEVADGAPAGCFTTRWVAARNAIQASQRAEADVRAKLTATNIWVTFRTTVDQVRPASLMDYALNRMKKFSATWYSNLDDQ